MVTVPYAGHYAFSISLLAYTIGKLNDSQAHFEDALAFCRKAGYRPELAWTCYDYSDTLFQRGVSGDREKAISQRLQCGILFPGAAGILPANR